MNGSEDEDTADDTATPTHSASGGGYGSVAIDPATVMVSDTTPVLTLGQDPAAVTEGEDIRLVVTADRALTSSLSVSLTLASRDGGGFDAGDVPGGLGPRSFDVERVCGRTQRSGRGCGPHRGRGDAPCGEGRGFAGASAHGGR